jgi:protein-L-isoaspartate(D-aspartate) O-methyltransferase
MEKPEADKSNGDAIALNEALVDDLKNRKCIQTPNVEAAFRAVLRHHFLPGTPWETVYSDRAISAKQNQEGQWLSSSSQPAIMGIMLEQLGLEPGHKVLEIGAGTGYNAALMAHIVGETGQVVTVDIDEDLVEAAREHLRAAGFEQVQVVCADGGYGYPDLAPFDRIILTVGAPDITPAWWGQLKPEGRIVLPLMLKGSMISVAFERVEDHLRSLSVQGCGFIQLRGDFAATGSKEVQLGPDPGLYLETLGESSIDSDAVYQLLTGVSKDWAAGVEVTVGDALMGPLGTWLALHESRMCKLVARGDMVEQNLVPHLEGIEAKQKSAQTRVLLGETGLVALMRPPDQPRQLLPMEKLVASDSAFPLYLRQFGPEDSLAKGLIAQIHAWDAAGRPSLDRMHIRAYVKDSEYTPAKGEIVLKKPWTKLIIEWNAVA